MIVWVCVPLSFSKYNVINFLSGFEIENSENYLSVELWVLALATSFRSHNTNKVRI